MSSILINFLGRSDGGPLFALEMAKGFLQNGVTVYALLSDQVSNKEEWDAEKGIIKHYIHTYSSKKEFVINTLLFGINSRREIKKIFKNIKIDFVVNPIFHLWSVKVSRLFPKAKVISVCHDVNPHSGENWIVCRENKRYILKCDYAVVLTKQFIDTLIETFKFDKNNVIYMPHGTFDNYRTIQTNNNVIEYDSEKINYLFFGRIQKYKGLHVLAEAYKELSSRHNNVTLTIAGNGSFDEYREEYEKLPNVTIINKYIPDEEVGCYFSGENIITVLPYLDATQSGVIPIAFEYKSVVVASASGGLVEQLDGGKIGVLFEPGNGEDLCRKMELVLTDRELREKQILLMDKYLENRSWDKIILKLMRDVEMQ